MKFFRQLLRGILWLLVVLSVLMVFCCVLLLGYEAVVAVQSTQALNEDLARIDPHFDTTIATLGPATTFDDLMPVQVGSFTRVGTIVATNSTCTIDRIRFPLTTEYRLNEFSSIAIGVFHCSNQMLSQITGISSCGADLGGELFLRNDSKTPYVYRVCYPCIGTCKEFGGGVLWANGDWLISIHGSRDDIVKFLHDYPY